MRHVWTTAFLVSAMWCGLVVTGNTHAAGHIAKTSKVKGTLHAHVVHIQAMGVTDQMLTLRVSGKFAGRHVLTSALTQTIAGVLSTGRGTLTFSDGTLHLSMSLQSRSQAVKKGVRIWRGSITLAAGTGLLAGTSGYGTLVETMNLSRKSATLTLKVKLTS